MKSSIVIIIFFALGIFIGYIVDESFFEFNDSLSTYALHFLLFLIGISIGADLKVFRIIKKLHYRILFVPISVIIGTLAGVASVSFLFDSISLNECLAIGSGFGYYSLSSIYITELRGETLGVIALLSNIIREVITLIGSPVLAKYFGKLAPIASGGATSMDTTLPIITRYSGKNYAVISVFSGTVLTLIVPFMVTLFL